MSTHRKPGTELIVALDVPAAAQADAAIAALEGLPVLFKVGLELFCAVGPEWVRKITGSGHRIFLDLKFHDIPNTVAKAANQVVGMGVEMFTYHLSSGPVCVRALHESIDEEAKRLGRKTPLALGVSVLTSFDDQAWSSVTSALAGTSRTPSKSVEGLLHVAPTWGVRGLVCSPHELVSASRIAPGIPAVVPGIRPQGADNQDQARVMTPEQAANLGAYAIVVGRPILGAADPRKAAEEILCVIKV
jgi:orotidine-5'-phosphate decarboxylase